MTAVRAPERTARPRAGARPDAAEQAPRAQADRAEFKAGGPPAGWTEVKVPAGATFESLALGDKRLADEIADRNVGRPAWTVEVDNRPKGFFGWVLGIFGVPARRQEARFGRTDELPADETLWLPRDLDPAAKAPPGFRRVALPDGRWKMADLTGGDKAREEAFNRANPDLDARRLSAGALYVNLPEDLPLPERSRPPDWGVVQPLEPKHPFLKELAPAAARIEQEHGIPSAVILAQAALESGLGSSRIGEYNVFGIKGAGSRGSLLLSTTEYSGGRRISTRARFANFGSWDEALRAHARIFEKPAFAEAMRHKDDPVAFGHALTGKYATDPRYGAKLEQTMREQGLLAD